MLEPIALPIAVSGAPCKDADAATIISGADEPMATIVKPIIIGDTPIFLAKEDAPKTNLSALHTKNVSAMSKIKTCTTINNSKIHINDDRINTKKCLNIDTNIKLSLLVE
jgi:hypothetical protein